MSPAAPDGGSAKAPLSLRVKLVTSGVCAAQDKPAGVIALVSTGNAAVSLPGPSGLDEYAAATNSIADGPCTLTVSLVDGGLASSTTLLIDGKPPALQAQAIDTFSYGANDGGFLPSDPDFGSDFTPVPAVVARKDETVRFQVTSVDNDIDAGSLQVALTAMTKDGGLVTWPLAPPTPCGAATFCREYTVPLGPTGFDGFRALMTMTATADDGTGNPSLTATSAPIGLTRWKWARLVSVGGGGADLRASPAIDDAGTVYVGIDRAAPIGGLAAVSVDGTLQQVSTVGPVVASPAIGFDGTRNWVFFESTAGGLRNVEGTACGTADGSHQGSVAILNDGLPGMRALGVVGPAGVTRQLRTLDPSVGCASQASSEATGVASIAFPGNLVTDNANIYYPSAFGVLKRFTVGAAFTPQSDIPVASGTIFGLSLFVADGGTKIGGGGGGGAGIGRVFVASMDGGVSGFNPSMHITATAVGLEGNAPVLYVVTQDSNEFASLQKFDATGTTALAGPVPLQLSFPIATSPGATTPVLGEGNFAYVVGNNGTVVAARQSTLAIQWRQALPAGITGPVQSSPTLDCNYARPGSGTGVLYFATGSGWLVANLVDSPGLDRSAPWPKYQHDTRNTGNSSVSHPACP